MQQDNNEQILAGPPESQDTNPLHQLLGTTLHESQDSAALVQQTQDSTITNSTIDSGTFAFILSPDDVEEE